MSIPAYNRYISSHRGVNETRWERVMIMLKEPENQEHIRALTIAFKQAFSPEQANGIEIYNFFEDSETDVQVNMILDTIFNVIIAITMFLCFFSLCSSMSANLLDQTKEIGVLRAMGFTKTRIKMLYFYEAFVLVMSSCLLGVMIGVIVGFTMVLQRAVFTGIPLVFYFPWPQFWMIMAISICCAFGSTWGPTSNLTKRDIASIFRSG